MPLVNQRVLTGDDGTFFFFFLVGGDGDAEFQTHCSAW